MLFTRVLPWNRNRRPKSLNQAYFIMSRFESGLGHRGLLANHLAVCVLASHIRNMLPFEPAIKYLYGAAQPPTFEVVDSDDTKFGSCIKAVFERC